MTEVKSPNCSTSLLDLSLFQDTLNTDLDLSFDDLPMPFRMLDKLLWNIFDEIWNSIETREKCRSKEFSFQQSCLEKLDVNMVGEYLFKTYENQVSVYDMNDLYLVSEWKYSSEISSCSSIRTYKTIQYNRNSILQLIIDDSGQTSMVMFVDGLFIPIKSINLPVDSLPYHTLNGKISPCGQFYVALNEDSVNSKIWLEIYRLPVDTWMKEILPIIQEFQNVNVTKPNEEGSLTQEITSNMIERKLFYENEFQLSSPVLLGRIKHPIMPSSPACKSVAMAVKQANDKAITEASQLTFIEHRNYPPCLTIPPKPLPDKENSSSVQGFTESPESTKQSSGHTTERSQLHTPSSIKRQPRNVKSSKHKTIINKEHKELTINQRNNQKNIEKPLSSIEPNDSLSNKDNEEQRKKKKTIKTINNNKKEENQFDIEALIKDTTDNEESNQQNEEKKILKTIQQNEEIRKQLIKEFNETESKCYPYFEFLPIRLSGDSKQSEMPSLNNMFYSGSICVYWTRSCYLLYYPLDKFTKAEEGVLEEIRYFGSNIISVEHFTYSTNETVIDNKYKTYEKSTSVNTKNDYLVIGLQSKLVIIKQLQSGKYLPILHIELGTLTDAALSINANYINLLTVCYRNVNKQLDMDNMNVYNKFTFDIYSFDRDQLNWRRTYITGNKKFHCQAITVLTVNDNYNIVVCLISPKDLLIYPLHQHQYRHHQQLTQQENQLVGSDVDQFCRNSIQISLPDSYIINLNTGTVGLFPEKKEQCIKNTELRNQLCLISSIKTSIQDVENDSHVNDEEVEDKSDRRQSIYQLWIRGTKIGSVNEDRIQSKLFRVSLNHF
ncbi:WD repeat-containing protein [Schistosoma japonicum]|uniref:WD repeat-containing protein n=1 Tax=Schistosoma japonicum TaxID=6182 RepID=A0A4Z2CNJ8_SCHJA|nr:WD repeat-containing protein [Schistosoma japonicum]